MKKRLIAFVVAVLCICMLCSPAFAVGYNDTKGHWGENAINRWSDVGVVQGSNGSFAPDKNMTRAEAAVMFARLKNLDGKADLGGFADIKADDWFYDAIAACVADGILNGVSETAMNPYAPITREMFFTMYARAMGIQEEPTLNRTMSDSGEISKWARGYVNALVNSGYVNGVGASTLAPQRNINRASVMTVLDNSIVAYVTAGGTVNVEKGGIVLVVTEKPVTIKGDADITVVVSAEDATVDLAAATGDIVVNVDAEDVEVKNAPEGTVVNADENTIVNGTKLSDDVQIIVEKETEEKTSDSGSTSGGGTSGGGGGFTPSIADSVIDGIISNGASSVNTQMALAGSYAELSVNTATNVVTVSIKTGTKTVTDVYNNIINVLVSKLNENYETVAELWTNTTANKLTLSATAITGQQVHDFVQGSTLHGPDGALDTIAGADTIDCLYGQSFVVNIVDVHKGNHPYTVKFVVDESQIDGILTNGAGSVNTQMALAGSYATLAVNGTTNVVTVSIKTGTKTVTDVYNNIINVLVSKLNENYKTVAELWTNTTANKLTLSTTAITGQQVHDFVQASTLHGPDGAEDTIAGADTIDCLYGQSFVVNIVDKAGETHAYTVKFVVDESQIDAILTNGAGSVNTQMALAGSYAVLDVNGTTNAVTVTISNGTKTVTDVYNNIINVLVSKLNENYKTVAELWTNTEANKLILSTTAITGQQVHDFVQASTLHGPDGEQDTIAGADYINCLYGQSFVVNIVDRAGETHTYTVSFVQATPPV